MAPKKPNKAARKKAAEKAKPKPAGKAKPLPANNSNLAEDRIQYVKADDLAKAARMENLRKANLARAKKAAVEAVEAENALVRKRISPTNIRYQEYLDAGIRRK